MLACTSHCALDRSSTDKKTQTTAKGEGKTRSVEQQGLPLEKDLLHTEDVASYLGVGQVTVWRWCRDGTLPCLKVGKELLRRPSSPQSPFEVLLRPLLTISER
jgi:excisionase family DNA binding protein